MGKPFAPCKGCGKRKERCHSVCEEYLDYVQRNREYQKVVREEKEKNAWTPSQVQGVVRAIKRRGVK